MSRASSRTRRKMSVAMASPTGPPEPARAARSCSGSDGSAACGPGRRRGSRRPQPPRRAPCAPRHGDPIRQSGGHFGGAAGRRPRRRPGRAGRRQRRPERPRSWRRSIGVSERRGRGLHREPGGEALPVERRLGSGQPAQLGQESGQIDEDEDSGRLRSWTDCTHRQARRPTLSPAPRATPGWQPSSGSAPAPTSFTEAHRPSRDAPHQFGARAPRVQPVEGGHQLELVLGQRQLPARGRAGRASRRPGTCSSGRSRRSASERRPRCRRATSQATAVCGSMR